MVEHAMANRIQSYMEMVDFIKKTYQAETEVALAVLQEVAKDLRTAQINDSRKSNGDQPATERQLEYLQNLGIKPTEGLTKREASSMIDGAVEKDGQ